MPNSVHTSPQSNYVHILHIHANCQSSSHLPASVTLQLILLMVVVTGQTDYKVKQMECIVKPEGSKWGLIPKGKGKYTLKPSMIHQWDPVTPKKSSTKAVKHILPVTSPTTEAVTLCYSSSIKKSESVWGDHGGVSGSWYSGSQKEWNNLQHLLHITQAENLLNSLKMPYYTYASRLQCTEHHWVSIVNLYWCTLYKESVQGGLWSTKLPVANQLSPPTQPGWYKPHWLASSPSHGSQRVT